MLFKSKGNIKLQLKFYKGIQLQDRYQQGYIDFCLFNETQQVSYSLNTDQELCSLLNEINFAYYNQPYSLGFQKHNNIMNIIKDELDPHYALEISESKSKILRFNMTRDQISETFNCLSYLIPGLYGWHRINCK